MKTEAAAIKPTGLDEWLHYIEALHPKSIAMGLERVKTVADRLQLRMDFPVIAVGGTNGKGSVCAMLSEIYAQAGYKVGTYTSPHLSRYNERVRINQHAISDEALCTAFAIVEAARAEVSLTYFEMGTLAAVWYFVNSDLDLAILEVGMGGRQDAVNVFEPSCAIVTGVDLDHMDYLGNTREKIGYEKAGIYRTGKLAICGDTEPPNSLIDYAHHIGAHLHLINVDFRLQNTGAGWQYQQNQYRFPLPDLALQGDFQRNNAACAICAVHHLQAILPVRDDHLSIALAQTRLPGRFSYLQDQPSIIADVAHNPQAAKSLQHNLIEHSIKGRTLAVFAMLADKDIAGVIKILDEQINAWYLANIHHIRGAQAAEIKSAVLSNNNQAEVQVFDAIATALTAACIDAGENDRIIVFGSFHTVAEAITALENPALVDATLANQSA